MLRVKPLLTHIETKQHANKCACIFDFERICIALLQISVIKTDVGLLSFRYLDIKMSFLFNELAINKQFPLMATIAKMLALHCIALRVAF